MNSMIDELLNRWEESCELGQPLTPEQLCAECPELLNEIRWQINALKAVDVRFGNEASVDQLSSQNALLSSRLNQVVEVESKFHIDRLHAKGGLGEIYLAHDPLLHRTVAVKFPRANHLSGEQLSRFEREAQITGRLNHPGIVPVHALKQNDASKTCYVMRFVDGPNLQNRIEKIFADPQSTSPNFFSSLAIRKLLQSFGTLCNIVAYAHSHGIIHRDIKPANVILGPFGETLLMDWGLAKEITEPEVTTECSVVSNSAETVVDKAVKTRAGQFMGTPAYASPEQRLGRVDIVDTRTDIYSLGATLLTLLTGKLPDGELTPASTLVSRSGVPVPRRLVAICCKALAENIEQRYATVESLHEDIECFLAGEPVSVVAETIWSKLSRTIRKNPGWVVAILVAVSMAIIAGVAGSMILGKKNQQLLAVNKNLELANASSLASQQRSSATANLLKNAMQAATPEVAQGKDPTLRQLLDDTSKQLRTDRSINPLVAADTHQVLADSYLSLGIYDLAQEHADRAHKLYLDKSGENSADSLSSQSTRALILSRRNQDDEAVRLARDALRRAQEVDELDAQTRIKVVDSSANVFSQSVTPDHAEIIALHREAYELAKAESGNDDRNTLRISTNLAVALIDSGNLEEGERQLMLTKQAHEDILGSNHPETLVDTFNLIVLLLKKKKFQEALELARSNENVFMEVFGVDHQRTIRLSLITTQLHFALGNVPAAEQVARIGLERALKSLGPTHHQTLEARGMLCGAVLALGRADEAQQLAQEQYKQTSDAFGDTHPSTIQAVTLLFDLAEARGDVEAMSSWFEKLRGSPWESAAQQALKTARDSKSSKSDAQPNSDSEK